jgi:hypothetical protein
MIADRRTPCHESLATSAWPQRPDRGSHGGSPVPSTGRIHPRFQQERNSNYLHETHDKRLYERLSAVLWVANSKTRADGGQAHAPLLRGCLSSAVGAGAGRCVLAAGGAAFPGGDVQRPEEAKHPGVYCPDDQEYLDLQLTRDNINGEQFVNLLRLLRATHPETCALTGRWWQACSYAKAEAMAGPGGRSRMAGQWNRDRTGRRPLAHGGRIPALIFCRALGHLFVQGTASRAPASSTAPTGFPLHDRNRRVSYEG